MQSTLNDNPGSPAIVFGNALGTRVSCGRRSRLGWPTTIRSTSPTCPATHPRTDDGGDFTVPDLAAGLVTSLAELGVEKFTYCGVSISGGIGLTSRSITPTL